MRITPAVRLFLTLISATLLPVSPCAGAIAQEETPAIDTSLVIEVPVTLPAGERTWVAISRAGITDDDPPVEGREGVLYAPDAPLIVLYEGTNRIERLPQGKAVALHEEDRARSVAMQEAPASLLAIGIADPETAQEGDAWLPVGEPFDVPAGDYTVKLHRYELTAGSDRIAAQVQRQISALPNPSLLSVEQGEITATPAGQDAAVPVTTGQAITADASSGLSVSHDGAVILLVTLEPKPQPTTTAPGSGSTSQTGGASQAPGGAPVSTATTAPTMAPTVVPAATTVPTVVPTLAPADTDGDGISDTDEAARGTNPNSSDSDGDGVFDGAEVGAGLDPLKPDTDGDGVSDYDEYGAGEQDPGSGDADGDGLTDGYEGQVTLTDPNNRDSDGDGLGDGFEVSQGTNPRSSDSDGDGVDDGYETGRGMNPNSTDSDGDGLGDGDEMSTYGTNPLNTDTDGDGRDDGYEVNVCGQDPAVYTDYTGVIVC